MRYLLPLLFVVSPVASSAEWIKVVETEASDTVVYIDSSSTTIRETRRRFWDLHALKAAGVNGERSRLWLREIDCPTARFRALAVIATAGEMGTGDILGRWNLEPKWEPILPETIVAEQSQLICAD